MANIFDMFYKKEVQWSKFSNADNKNRESGYLTPTTSKCTRGGQRKYKRGTESDEVLSAYQYQTNDLVNEKDKYDGHIVKSVEEKDFLGIKFRIVTVDVE